MSEIVTVVNQWSTNQPLPVGKSPCWEIEIVGNVFRESWTPLLRAPRCALTVTPTGRGYVMGNAIAFAATLAAAPPSDELHTTPGARTVVKFPFSSHYNNDVIRHLNHTCNTGVLHCNQLDLFEFGVLTGRSLKGLVRALNQTQINFRRSWGFDSFVGLPQEERHKQGQLEERGFTPGAFSASQIIHERSYSKLEATILKFINDSRVTLVRGFYNESLTPTLATERQMKPALMVEVDCDLYTSTRTALDWLFTNKLLVVGTLIVYNDWRGFGGAQSGEAEAHAEVMKKYGAKGKFLWSAREKLFRLESVPYDAPS